MFVESRQCILIYASMMGTTISVTFSERLCRLTKVRVYYFCPKISAYLSWKLYLWLNWIYKLLNDIQTQLQTLVVGSWARFTNIWHSIINLKLYRFEWSMSLVFCPIISNSSFLHIKICLHIYAKNHFIVLSAGLIDVKGNLYMLQYSHSLRSRDMQHAQ